MMNVLRQVTDMVLQKALTQYMRQHPGSTMDQAIAHAIKYKIPKGICQTPRWHKEKLDDLIAMVKKWGMCVGYVFQYVVCHQRVISVMTGLKLCSLRCVGHPSS
jgi:hypothetical protein